MLGGCGSVELANLDIIFLDVQPNDVNKYRTSSYISAAF